jgi:MoaA/NifB/PqqE/SkfB family radical SAM enzyme
MHNNSIGGYTPVELYENPTATHVSPKIVEIFAFNTCNLACVYCDDKRSSKIEMENKKYNPLNSLSLSNNKEKMYNNFK